MDGVSFKFSLHFITNAMRENASAYFIYVDIAVLLSVLSLAGRNFCMFVTKRKQERKRVRKDTHYNEQKMSR